MRVTINYSIDTEEIPNEIRKLCKEAFVHVADVSDLEYEWAESLDMKGYDRAHEILGQARERLLAIDSRFADCQSILLGYQKVLLAEKMEREEAMHANQMAFDFPTKELPPQTEEEAVDE